MNTKLISKGFIAAALMNITGPLIFSKCFTNEVLNQADPIVMSNFGLMMIMVWGFCYLSVAQGYEKVPWVSAVFCIEKLIYVAAWGYWHSTCQIGPLFEQDLFAGIFYCIYGLNDLLFTGFFAWVFIKTKNQQ